MQMIFQKVYRLLKSNVMKLFPALLGEQSREFRFYKQYNRWYVDLPEWKGPKWHLEMVDGADYLLDSLKDDGKNDVVLYVSLEHFLGSSELIKTIDDAQGDGADYSYWNSENQQIQILWLCGVTSWYYGTMPEKIYYRKVLD
jgi:hypothetical protein